MNQRLLCLVMLLGVACQQDTPSPASITQQTERVAKARADLSEEEAKLKVLLDSLNIKVAENVNLGMSEDQAQAVEEALIDVQKAVVEASKQHLTHQEELLALMQSKVE